jgi:hypothetical protein
VIVDATGWELEPTPWAAQAACAGQPADVWFPERGGSAATAKSVCAHCPVRIECLDYALRWGIGHGVWGGLSMRERRRLSRRSPRPPRVLAAHGTTTSYARGCRCKGCTEASSLHGQLSRNRKLPRTLEAT